ncbi:Carbonic anhydrase or acetyltransferase, isoleucine patch superfamily [Paenibacillus sophorae]|uniref:Dynactin subunit 6 n=1 Tax=Paenibacillus sophorae TaxID=1333845 RepID=A0A1H8FFN5_9BACL|nr:DapH/DapD/GlmU-related protein [Paenibacillus sophorae]QWU13861.1 hypothetical protein KP014_18095 [Paenibacillus sophorae]SEN30671.1 Carbonic anhydrase or acetyltransferase, isoleucine patch superfamily [Paenibacillus sophorae]
MSFSQHSKVNIDPSAIIMEGVIINGDVSIGAETVVLSGAVISSEGSPLQIGGRCIIMENAVLRATKRHPLTIEDHVLVGPHSHVSGAIIGEGSFIATGATIFGGSELGEGCMIGVNAVVHIGTCCPESFFVPIGYTAVGNPAEVFSPLEIERVHDKIFQMGFTNYLFNFDSHNMTNGEATKLLCDKYVQHYIRNTRR